MVSSEGPTTMYEFLSPSWSPSRCSCDPSSWSSCLPWGLWFSGPPPGFWSFLRLLLNVCTRADSLFPCRHGRCSCPYALTSSTGLLYSPSSSLGTYSGPLSACPEGRQGPCRKAFRFPGTRLFSSVPSTVPEGLSPASPTCP